MVWSLATPRAGQGGDFESAGFGKRTLSCTFNAIANPNSLTVSELLTISFTDAFIAVILEMRHCADGVRTVTTMKKDT